MYETKQTKPSKIIKTDSLLAFILEKRSQITIQQLKQIRDLVETKDSSLIVDISGPSIELALYYYPNLFDRRGNEIYRTKDLESVSQYLKEGFYSDFDKDLTQLLDDSISEVYQ